MCGFWSLIATSAQMILCVSRLTPLLQGWIGPEEVVEGAAVAEFFQVDPAVQEYDTFRFQPFPLLSVADAVRREGDFSLCIDYPVPGQLHAAGSPPHGLGNPPCRTAHAGQAGDFAIGQHVAGGNPVDHLPDSSHPLIELGPAARMGLGICAHYGFVAHCVYASILAQAR